jgi:predicted CXXCH cytochrome family protein
MISPARPDRHRAGTTSPLLRPLAGAAGALLLSAAWLLLAAAPVFADGGPHVMTINNGSAGINADSCAGCHRAHTAQAPLLLAASGEEPLCLSCHGATGLGATTNVEDGVQFAAHNDGSGTGPVAGALRGGGFIYARLDSGSVSRISFPRIDGSQVVTGFSALVPVRASGQATTSAHLDLGAPGVTATGSAWGNGPVNTASARVDLGCTSCHNPHGNGQYRILRPIPNPSGVGTTPAFVPATTAATVTDLPNPAGTGAAGTRNYTVQPGRTLGDVLTADLGPTAGDYWRRYLPWDGVPTWTGTNIAPATGEAGDKPEYVAGGTNLTSWRGQITLWCSTCHTRYNAPNNAANNPSGDVIYAYRHRTQQQECTQCHVAHGSNAQMPGAYSGDFPYPGGAVTSGSSRLLKIDDRGTCQACHDPTGTIPYTGIVQP